jgi:hypothetical protein
MYTSTDINVPTVTIFEAISGFNGESVHRPTEVKSYFQKLVVVVVVVVTVAIICNICTTANINF